MKVATHLGILFLLLTGVTTQTVSAQKLDPSKPYWLRHSLAVCDGSQTRVFLGSVVNCGLGALTKGTKVKIYSISLDKGFTKIVLRHWAEVFEYNSEYAVLLENKSEVQFQKVFAQVFSPRRVEPFRGDCPSLRTKADVIRCMGFPAEIEKIGDTFTYVYPPGFLGIGSTWGSADAWSIKIKHNRVIEISETF